MEPSLYKSFDENCVVKDFFFVSPFVLLQEVHSEMGYNTLHHILCTFLNESVLSSDSSATVRPVFAKYEEHMLLRQLGVSLYGVFL